MAIRIFIDQGHNPSGVNAGAEGNGLREQDVTYNVGIYLANLLNDDPRFTARVSRPTPETVLGTSNATSLQARVNMANSWPADYFTVFTVTPIPILQSMAVKCMFIEAIPNLIGLLNTFSMQL